MSTAREQQLRYVASRLNMSFSPDDEYGLLSLLDGFQLFNIGRRKKISNILRREEDFGEMDLRIFDYEYARGKSKRRHRQTVFFIQSKQLGLPQMLMKPESLFNKIGAYLGMQDIDFESHPEFSKKYLLQGEDEELVRAIMDEKVLQFFTIEKGWYLEGIGYYLIVYKKYKLLGPRSITKFYQKGMDIHGLLKDDWDI